MGLSLKRTPGDQRDPDRELALLHVADERGRVWFKNFRRVLLAILLAIVIGTAAITALMTALNGHLPAGQELHDLVQLVHLAPSP
jgi:hypothetical protein